MLSVTPLSGMETYENDLDASVQVYEAAPISMPPIVVMDAAVEVEAFASTASAPGASVNVTHVGSTITIAGTNNSDWIRLEQSATTIWVHSYNPTGTTRLNSWDFNINSVSQIDFFGYDGNDTFLGGNVSVALRLDGGTGNNRLVGGAGNDWIYGGLHGNSILDTGIGGDNIVIGGYGTNIFYNNTTGSNGFIWAGYNNRWATGHSNDANDGFLILRDTDRLGNTSFYYDDTDFRAYGYDFGRGTAHLRPWAEAEILRMGDHLRSFYSVVGTYAFFQNWRNPDNEIYCTVTSTNVRWGALHHDGNSLAFATNYADAITFNMFVYSFASYWRSTPGSSWMNGNPYWSSFASISWESDIGLEATRRDGAVVNDFANTGGMRNSFADWADTVTYVVMGITPPNASAKWYQKVDIVNQFFGWLRICEEQSTVVTTLDDVVDRVDGKISLREAIAYARPGSTILFDPSLHGQTIMLDGNELLINKDITIDATGMNITIDANQKSRVFYIAGATVELIGLTITGGVSSEHGGGGIGNWGTLTVVNCTIYRLSQMPLINFVEICILTFLWA